MTDFVELTIADIAAVAERLPDDWSPPVIPTVVTGNVVAGWINNQPMVRFLGPVDGYTGGQLSAAIMEAVDDLHDLLEREGVAL